MTYLWVDVGIILHAKQVQNWVTMSVTCNDMPFHSCVLQACNQEPAAVQQAYNDLLDRCGGDSSKPDVRAPKQRIRVLKSLHSVLIERRNDVERQRSYMSYQAFRTKEKQEVSQGDMFNVLKDKLLHTVTAPVHNDLHIEISCNFWYA